MSYIPEWAYEPADTSEVTITVTTDQVIIRPPDDFVIAASISIEGGAIRISFAGEGAGLRYEPGLYTILVNGDLMVSAVAGQATLTILWLKARADLARGTRRRLG